MTINDLRYGAVPQVCYGGKRQRLEKFYKAPAESELGNEKFRNKLMAKPLRVDREYPRYERAAVKLSLDQLLVMAGTLCSHRVTPRRTGRPPKIGCLSERDSL